MTREETIQDYAISVINPHLDDIEELTMQMKKIIEELAEKCELDDVEELANPELIVYHIQKIKDYLGVYRTWQ